MDDDIKINLEIMIGRHELEKFGSLQRQKATCGTGGNKIQVTSRVTEKILDS